MRRLIREKLTWTKVSKVLKNSYVSTILLFIIVLGGVFAFWGTLRTVLRTEYPGLAVISGSMIPTLDVGDLIVVQGVSNASEIRASPALEGDILVFRRPYGHAVQGFLFADPDLIVHRAVNKVFYNGTFYFQTQGDNNSGPDTWGGPGTREGMISERLVVGKVVGVIPSIGNVPLFIRTPQGIVLIIFLYILILLIEYIPVLWRKQEED